MSSENIRKTAELAMVIEQIRATTPLTTDYIRLTGKAAQLMCAISREQQLTKVEFYEGAGK